MPLTAGRHHIAGFELETGDVIDARPMNLIVDYNLNFFIYNVMIYKHRYILQKHTIFSYSIL